MANLRVKSFSEMRVKLMTLFCHNSELLVRNKDPTLSKHLAIQIFFFSKIKMAKMLN